MNQRYRFAIGIAALLLLVVGGRLVLRAVSEKSGQTGAATAATSTPTPHAQVELGPTPMLLLPAQNGFAGQPQPLDFENLRKTIKGGPEGQKMPKEAIEHMENSMRRLQNAFSSESAARDELRDLRICIEHTNRMGPLSLPPETQAEFKEQLPHLPTQMQAGCLLTGMALAQKFPSLRKELDNQILSRAKPEAIALARKMSSEPGWRAPK